jgi:hypothetical protein
MKWFVTAANRLDHVDLYRWQPQDAAPLKLVKRIEAPKTPSHLSIDSKHVVYVSLQDSDELLAIDLATQAARWKIRRQDAGRRVPHPRRPHLLVGLTGDKFVEVYDVSASPAQAGQAHRPATARTPSARGRRQACVRQQPRGQHHQHDRHADDERGGRAARPWRPGLHGDDGRRPHAAGELALGAQADASSTSRRARWCARSTSAARRMACGRWTMRRATERLAALLALALAGGCRRRPGSGHGVRRHCDKPVYLTFDTGHMAVAPLVAEVLPRHGVKATFFLANERTRSGGSSLDDNWAPWWRERGRRPRLRLAHLGPRRLAGRHARGLRVQADAGPAGRARRAC